MLDFGYYNIDCMEGMREFPDKYFDLAIVDPPYGDGGGYMEQRRTFRGTFRQVSEQYRGGVARQTGISPRDSEKVKVHRSGGTWAEKFGKKS